MDSVVCTLFENHYHYGVASLANSLSSKGYCGPIYVGYRGILPNWTSTAKQNSSLWPGCKTLDITNRLQLHFIPLNTDYHLTNYKPDLMIQLWDGPAKEAKKMFYFDPDIVVNAPWKYFEEWVRCGVALCEDINSPLSEFHPRREAWRRYFGEKGILLNFKDSIYVNGGFVGLSKNNQNFLEVWKNIQEAMAPIIGGLSRSSLSGPSLPKEYKGPYSPFGKTDQDALNAAIEAWKGKFSLVGQEGMALKPGVPLMSHALGQPKPWQWEPLSQMLLGKSPRSAVREYWKNANGSIVSQSKYLIQSRLISIRLAALIGRFYKSG